MITGLLLIIASLATSAIAGILGLGGGLLLIAILPFLLPAQVVIPLHGLAQIASNGSRALFTLDAVQWPLFPKFFLGSLLGILVFASFLRSISTEYIPLFIALYILGSQWSEAFNRFIKQWESFYLAGFFQTGLGLIVGATGQLTTTLLQKQQLDKEQIVATSALMMLFTHICKIAVFAVIGLQLLAHWFPALMLVVGAILGSWVGTLYRQSIPEKSFQLLLKWLLTLLALIMLMKSILF